jgi:hypothetical protein
MKWLFFFTLIVTALSCDKVERAQNKLEGSWVLRIVRIEDGDGFTFYDSLATGSIEFTKGLCSAGFAYQYNYFGQNVVHDTVVFNDAPTFFTEDSERFFLVRDTDTLTCRILMLTNRSLTFEYYDQLAYRLKRYTCQKAQ